MKKKELEKELAEALKYKDIALALVGNINNTYYTEQERDGSEKRIKQLQEERIKLLRDLDGLGDVVPF